MQGLSILTNLQLSMGIQILGPLLRAIPSLYNFVFILISLKLKLEVFLDIDTFYFNLGHGGEGELQRFSMLEQEDI